MPEKTTPNRILSTVAKAIEQAAQHDLQSKEPVSVPIFYQPERPQQKNI